MRKIILWIIIGISSFFVNPLNAQNMKLKVTVGNQDFTAIVNDSETVNEFVKLLPMEVSMNEHNGNEKYCNLPRSMPGKATNPGSIQAGDLMIWSSGILVLFYAGSRSSYSYIRLGRIDNPSTLREAVGRGSTKVKFELINDNNLNY